MLARWPEVGTWGEWFAGFAAIVAVGIAWLAWQASKAAVRHADESADAARESAAAARESIELTRQSVDAARETLRESIKSRIDARSPLISVSFDAVREPWRVAGLDRLPSLGDTDVWNYLAGNRHEVVSPFAADESSRGVLYFYLDGAVWNEGSASAQLRIDGYGRFSGPYQIGGMNSSPDFTEPSTILRPQHVVRFRYYFGHSIGTWVREWHRPNTVGRTFIELPAFDLQSKFVDHIYIEIGGRPLVPVGLDQPGQWVLAPEPNYGMAASAYPIQRTYLALNEPPRPPPWSND